MDPHVLLRRLCDREGATFEKLYAPSPYHRLQADALLKCQLHIGDSLHQVRHDLAWHNGQVNHV